MFPLSVLNSNIVHSVQTSGNSGDLIQGIKITGGRGGGGSALFQGRRKERGGVGRGDRAGVVVVMGAVTSVEFTRIRMHASKWMATKQNYLLPAPLTD